MGGGDHSSKDEIFQQNQEGVEEGRNGVQQRSVRELQVASFNMASRKSKELPKEIVSDALVEQQKEAGDLVSVASGHEAVGLPRLGEEVIGEGVNLNKVVSIPSLDVGSTQVDLSIKIVDKGQNIVFESVAT
ncbi:unnamed protein product [Ilex paraguariensis]|uniref:Uncharacterized protein n=1 Tax=Ilex paraguariensis TaxID=185542 RepID=A0ABC8RXV6_9AQUA